MSQGQQRGHETLANGVGDPLAARGPGISLRSMPPCCEQTAGEQEVQRGQGGLRPPGEHVLRDPGSAAHWTTVNTVSSAWQAAAWNGLGSPCLSRRCRLVRRHRPGPA
jgi:hypothetical protein